MSNKIYDKIRDNCLKYYGKIPEQDLSVNYFFKSLPNSKLDDSHYILDEVLINHLDSAKRLLLTMMLEDTFSLTTSDINYFMFDEPDDSLYKDYTKNNINDYTKKHILYENQVVSNLTEAKHDKVNESIFSSVGKLPFIMGGKGWANHVICMAIWYNENVETYLSGESASSNSGIRKSYKCPLIGNNNVYDDCSSFVFACLTFYGLLHKGNIPSSNDYCGELRNKEFSEELKRLGFYNLSYDEEILRPFDIVSLNDSNGHHVEIYGGKDKEGNRFSYGWGNNNSKKKGKKLPHKFVEKRYTSIWRTNDVWGGLIGNIIYNNEEETSNLISVDFSNYKGGIISVDKLVKLFPWGNKNYMAAAVLALDKYGSKVGLNDKGKLMVLGQFAHESGNFVFTAELGKGKGKAYGKPSGPYGKIYYGRGPIQVTWEENYKTITRTCFPKLGINADIHKNPDLCCSNLEIGCAASLCWFMLAGNGKRAIAAANAGDVKALTKAINGGYNGLQDRINKTNKIFKAIS